MKKSLGAKTLAVPTPVWIVGSYDDKDRANVMAAAWGGICCSKPPCVTVSLRKATYSYGCLMKRRAYTINILSQTQIAEADYFGIVSGRDRNKFTDTGYTPVKSNLVDAPYIAEAPMVLECRVLHTFEIGLHTQFVGEILDVKADESVLNDKGLPDIQKIQPMIYAPGTQSYCGIGAPLEKGYSVGMKFKS